MILGKYSFGIGDRFGHQGKAQLSAVIKAKDKGLDITPVWNKSHREHTIIGTAPDDVRKEAKGRMERIGCRNVLRVLRNWVLMMVKKPEIRGYYRTALKEPKDLVSAWVYGIYSGQKPE